MSSQSSAAVYADGIGATSYWFETASRSEEYPPLVEDLEVDVAIIGAGITGLSCA